jgi:hypothetical protein
LPRASAVTELVVTDAAINLRGIDFRPIAWRVGRGCVDFPPV